MEHIEHELAEITHAVLDAVGTGEVVDAPAPPDITDAKPTVTGSVQISGAWDGTVRVQFTDSLARQLTAAMFEVPPDETAGDDIRDAVGEVANMIGGNVKALLPEPCVLSLPRVEEGDEPADGDAVGEVAFGHDHDAVRVRVLKNSADPPTRDPGNGQGEA